MAQSIERARQKDQSAETRLTLPVVADMTGYSLADIALVLKTVAKDAPLIELATFLHACTALRLDPLLKQAYWIRRRSREQVDGQWQDVYRGTLQIGIDGFRSLADRRGDYLGSDAPIFYDWFELEFAEPVAGGGSRARTVLAPGRAQVIVRKVVKGHVGSFVGEARWTEFYPGDGADGRMWRRMPANQLAKCAEAQALRKGWPHQLNGIELNDDGEVGDLADGSPFGVPTSTVTIAEQPRRAPLTAADYDRAFGSDADADSAADAPAKDAGPPADAAPDPRSRRDKAEDQATAKQQEAALA
jgi:phage recombination protein Bet